MNDSQWHFLYLKIGRTDRKFCAMKLSYTTIHPQLTTAAAIPLGVITTSDYLNIHLFQYNTL